MAVGTTYLWTGIKTLRFGYSSTRWPTAEAKVISSNVVQKRATSHSDRNSRHPNFTYQAEVEYQFSAAGSTYTSNNIEFGQRGSRDPSYARATVDLYPVGSSTTVSYAPDQPAQSVLRPGLNAKACINPAVGGTFFVFGLALYMLVSSADAKRRKNHIHFPAEQVAAGNRL